MNESIHGERTASELQDRVTELIEQQTAISEVLRAIASSPHAPVLTASHNQARSKTCVHHRDPKIIPKIAFNCCQVGDVDG